MTKIALLVALLSSLVPALAGTLPTLRSWADCNIDKYQRYAQAQAQWQERLAALVTATAPEHAAHSDQLMRQQLQLIEQSQLELEHLVRHEPARLHSQASLNTWLSPFDAEDRQFLAARSPRYAELLRVGKAHQPPHSQGDKLHTLMREDIMKRPDFGELLQQHLQAVKAIEGIQCPALR
ncbi:hypothetical protein OOZ63_22815 [Paucibacter sp. PLA-PC-4]|uniref:hypothetical protein n=1 Tax=Paucibacter sp. PLA-PC-4 TaxID=2993655 RepID=UPI00224B8EC9|nr:hypothetical protein [Paucibacter sp. PLA-PC-4]MCX2864668.1 hypothetical protein [Paucibacter sp. PLA-PC-4]